MPSTLPSSFASAAAGNNDQRSSSRADGGLADWSRRTNGATQTFRRPSLATTPSSSSNLTHRDFSASSMAVNPPTPGAYVPPHISASRNDPTIEMRYTKDQLLDLYKRQRDAGDLGSNLTDLYVGESDVVTNGNGSAKWGRRDEIDDLAAELCWERQGNTQILGILEMTEEERELFTSSVNSPLKAPVPTAKDNSGHREAGSTRKSSISHGQSASALPSPLITRSGNRRRENSESYPFPKDINASTSGGSIRATRDEGNIATTPSVLLRKRTDFFESPTDSAADKDRLDKAPGAGTPSGSLKRAPSGFGAGLAGGPASPWGIGSQSLASPGGAFGSFALGVDSALNSPVAEKRPGFGQRGESRFRTLMMKEGGEDSTVEAKDESYRSDKESQTIEGREQHFGQASDPVKGDDQPIGSAALGGANDESPSYATPNRGKFNGDGGLSGHNGAHGSDDYDERRSYNHYQNQQYHGNHDEGHREGGSLSPTYTNPYQSPEQQIPGLNDPDNDESDLGFHLPGLGGFRGEDGSAASFGGNHTLPRSSSGFDRAFERQPSSSNLNRGFPGLGGLGGLGSIGSSAPWPPAIGTPSRERSGIFDSLNESSLRSSGGLHSPALAGLGSVNTFGAPGSAAGTIGRSSRLGSLFPVAMQDQVRGANHGQTPKGDEESFDQRPGRGKFDDFFGGDDARTSHSAEHSDFTGEASAFGQGRAYSPAHQSLGGQGVFGHQQPALFGQPGQRTHSSLSSSASNQPPPAQQKTMVMPDRIRWIYRDPQGNTQGPWSGLEMHDWYRAGFFSPELLVKKQEDPEYEPLAQLIRRIGNSREPFLVPQIGIPGPPSTQAGGNWPAPSAAPSISTSTSAAQPPFAGSFPSFGTTLTAEQQNALERRKQEEQFLMARQKEHLAQQQVLAKQMQLQGQPGILPPQLHQHSSAHSLHSQPSFGSLTSASTYGNTLQGLSGHFDNTLRLGAVGAIGSGVEKLGHIQEEEGPGLFQRLNQGLPSQSLFNGGTTHDNSAHDQRVSNMLSDRNRLQQEQMAADSASHSREEEAPWSNNDRYQQFQNLRSQMNAELDAGSANNAEQEQPAVTKELLQESKPLGTSADLEGVPSMKHNLSLTEQVQKAASAKQSPAAGTSPVWAKHEAEPLEAFQPPPQSASPLPAPAAQRNRSHVADALAAESSSQRASPSISVETPTTSLAPWAKEPAEAHKQPSLREIQEAEARRAAKQEEIIAAARRAALEKELATLATQAIQPAPGLPSSSNWATTESPATPSSAASAWIKPTAGKVASGGSVTKKTLQQIQKEEEALARKQRAAALTASSAAGVSSTASAAQALASGKRYADLASKVAAGAPASPANSAWTTVGASGKVKLPVSSTPTGVRAASASPAPAAVVAKPKAAVALRSTTTTSVPNALEEFNKWAVSELASDLNKGIPVDDFVQGLMSFPSDLDVITEAVHSVSQTIDSRHFAEEYVRRRALAEKGKFVEASNVSSGHHAGGSESKGWSEVARRGPVVPKVQEESNMFKIVPSKKKAGKK